MAAEAVRSRSTSSPCFMLFQLRTEEGRWRAWDRQTGSVMRFGLARRGDSNLCVESHSANPAEVVGRVGNPRRVGNPPEPLVSGPAGAGCRGTLWVARRIPSCPTFSRAYLGSFAERKKGAPEDFPEPTRKEDTNHKFHGWGKAANCLDREGGPRHQQRPQSQPRRAVCRDRRRAPQARLWAACSASSLLFTHAISAVRSGPLARGRKFPAARGREPPLVRNLE